jgi:rhodanese-related sulfurtransferase
MRSLIHASIQRAVLLASVAAVPMAPAISPSELATRMAANEPLVIIDVRSATAYAAGHVPGAINIPVNLLPYKPLPTGQPVIVCGDGLGVVDATKALDVVRSKVTQADVLVGGYAAWLTDTRLSTIGRGVTREQFAGITYDQLVVATKGDIVLVDLRGTNPGVAHALSDSTAIAAAASDPLQDFAMRLGVPLLGGTPKPKAGAAARALSAPALDALNQPGKLLVLVANDESVANETARQLRARGIYRFTILIGGMEAIRYEGKIGSGRMTGGVYGGETQP